MEREQNRRDGIFDADATGMLAGEELIAQAETQLPLQGGFPASDLHAALPQGHAAHRSIDRLHAELQKPQPDARAIHAHVGVLRELPELEAALANWWDDPKTQRVIANLGQIGL
jgi:hypothetical protein